MNKLIKIIRHLHIDLTSDLKKLISINFYKSLRKIKDFPIKG